MNHKNPDLNIRYAVGIGDLVACILHSKPLSWLVKLITGKEDPCPKCSKRRQALNILFPFKFWKLFFRDEIVYLENLKDFYIKCGFKASLNYENKYVTVSKLGEVPDYPTIQTPTEFKKDEIIKRPITLPTTKKEGYIFLSSSEMTLGDHLIKTEYYKKN